jgi:hypothetical protein
VFAVVGGRGGGGGAREEGRGGGVGLDFRGAACGLSVEVYRVGVRMWGGGMGEGRAAYWSCEIRDLLVGRCGLGRPGNVSRW